MVLGRRGRDPLTVASPTLLPPPLPPQPPAGQQKEAASLLLPFGRTTHGRRARPPAPASLR